MSDPSEKPEPHDPLADVPEEAEDEPMVERFHPRRDERRPRDAERPVPGTRNDARYRTLPTAGKGPISLRVLSEEDARQLRKRYRKGERVRDLAREYRVSRPTVCQIGAGQTYRDADAPFRRRERRRLLAANLKARREARRVKRRARLDREKRERERVERERRERLDRERLDREKEGKK